MSPLVSIVIPSYNSIDLIQSCIENITKTTYRPLEIIISDDCSTDGSYKFLQNYIKQHRDLNITIIRNEKNKGPSVTRNNGVKKAQGKYIAFLETDTEVEPNWLQPAIQKLESDPTIGAMQPKILELNYKNIISSDGIYFDPHTFWVVSDGCGLDTNTSITEKQIATGAVGSIMRKDMLEKIAVFDEKIVHNIDDIDLAWRIWLTGYTIWLVPQSIIYHWTMKPLSLRTKTTPGLQSETHFQKTFRIFLKNYQWQNVIRYTPWLYAVFLARALSNLKRGNTTPFKGLWASTLWNIQNLSDTLKERKRIQALRKRSDAELFNSIFLKGNFFWLYKNKIAPMQQRAAKSFNTKKQ